MGKKKPEDNTPDPDQASQSPIDRVLSHVTEGVIDGPALCTGWVLISEWMDENGDYYTHVATDSHNPPWRHHGLVTYAAETGLDVYEDDYEDDE